MNWIKITKATHIPSGNIKLYSGDYTAKEAIKKSEDSDINNWKLESEFVWS